MFSYSSCSLLHLSLTLCVAVCFYRQAVLHYLTPPKPVPSQVEKGGGLGVGPVTPPRKNYHTMAMCGWCVVMCGDVRFSGKSDTVVSKNWWCAVFRHSLNLGLLILYHTENSGNSKRISMCHCDGLGPKSWEKQNVILTIYSLTTLWNNRSLASTSSSILTNALKS